MTAKESDIQSAICEYLSLKGYFFSRSNNVAIYDNGSSWAEDSHQVFYGSWWNRVGEFCG